MGEARGQPWCRRQLELAWPGTDVAVDADRHLAPTFERVHEDVQGSDVVGFEDGVGGRDCPGLPEVTGRHLHLAELPLQEIEGPLVSEDGGGHRRCPRIGRAGLPALTSGGITGPSAHGVANALKQKFDAIQHDMGVPHYTPALADLKAFIDQVDAQCCTPSAGKEITSAFATTLELDALLVFHNALCKAIAADEITAVREANEYSYSRIWLAASAERSFHPADSARRGRRFLEGVLHERSLGVTFASG